MAAASLDAKEAIRAEALRLGFTTCGFAEAVLPESVRDGLNAFVEAGAHGETPAGSKPS